MKKNAISFLALLLVLISGTVLADMTQYGKITNIQTRAWGLHVQTTFSYSRAGCAAVAGQAYMYDFVFDEPHNSSPTAQVEVSVLLAALASQQDVAFHISECNTTRPKIRFISIRNN